MTTSTILRAAAIGAGVGLVGLALALLLGLQGYAAPLVVGLAAALAALSTRRRDRPTLR